MRELFMDIIEHKKMEHLFRFLQGSGNDLRSVCIPVGFYRGLSERPTFTSPKKDFMKS